MDGKIILIIVTIVCIAILFIVIAKVVPNNNNEEIKHINGSENNESNDGDGLIYGITEDGINERRIVMQNESMR